MPAPLIVLAEDNRELRALLAIALEASGYRIVQAETGTPMLAAVSDVRSSGEAVSLIITDVRMPHNGGVDAARALRATGDQTPLILMTSYGDAWTHGQAASVGATLIDKPLRIAELRDAVKHALGD